MKSIIGIGISEFREAFERHGRSDQFSYEGLETLFDFIKEHSEGIELDVIGLCSDFAEYPTALEAVNNLSGDTFEDNVEAIKWLEENGILLFVDDDDYEGPVIVAGH